MAEESVKLIRMKDVVETTMKSRKDLAQLDGNCTCSAAAPVVAGDETQHKRPIHYPETSFHVRVTQQHDCPVRGNAYKAHKHSGDFLLP